MEPSSDKLFLWVCQEMVFYCRGMIQAAFRASACMYYKTSTLPLHAHHVRSIGGFTIRRISFFLWFLMQAIVQLPEKSSMRLHKLSPALRPCVKIILVRLYAKPVNRQEWYHQHCDCSKSDAEAHRTLRIILLETNKHLHSDCCLCIVIYSRFTETSTLPLFSENSFTTKNIKWHLVIPNYACILLTLFL